jgi:hypothetical protein
VGKRIPARSVSWTTWEVCSPSHGGSWNDPRRPVSETMARSGDPTTTAIGKMKLLQTLGLPEGFRSLIIEKADGGDPTIYILKCKPCCWRLYFYACKESETAKRIVYLHAKCKKKNKQDPDDAKHARLALGALDAGGMRIIRFQFPSG